LQATALEEPVSTVSYDVGLPEAGLGWQKVGPLFERYSIVLEGLIDDRWVEAYRRISSISPNFSRFRLDPLSARVSFTCRATDGPVEVMSVLKILGGMLDRVNREASRPPESLDGRQRPNRAAPRQPETKLSRSR